MIILIGLFMMMLWKMNDSWFLTCLGTEKTKLVPRISTLKHWVMVSNSNRAKSRLINKGFQKICVGYIAVDND